MALTERQQKRRDWLEKAIAAIEAAQMGTISSEAQQMTFNGRSITRFSPFELERLRSLYERQLAKLDRAEAGTTTRTIRVIG